MESTGIPFARPQSNVARLREERSESREPGTVPCRFVREPCRSAPTIRHGAIASQDVYERTGVRPVAPRNDYGASGRIIPE